MNAILANIELEGAVVGVVCIVFMVLMVVAGVKQKIRDGE